MIVCMCAYACAHSCAEAGTGEKHGESISRKVAYMGADGGLEICAHPFLMMEFSE